MAFGSHVGLFRVRQRHVTKRVPRSRLRGLGHDHFRLINHGRKIRLLHKTIAEQLPRDIVVGFKLLANGHDPVVAGQLSVRYQSHHY